MDDNTVQLYSGYEEIGIPGKNTLRQLLTDSTTPEAFRSTILGFQHENGIILPSLQPMLPLLHLLNIRSLEFHESVMEELRQKLINRIEEIASKVEPEERDSKLKVLLQKSFPFIKVPMIQPVVMELLKNIEVVDDKYINMLVNDQSLYQNCDVSVKRHIWQQHQTLLIKELSPLLATYIKDVCISACLNFCLIFSLIFRKKQSLQTSKILANHFLHFHQKFEDKTKFCKLLLRWLAGMWFSTIPYCSFCALSMCTHRIPITVHFESAC